ncbi:MAG: hypothetical protein QOJ72_1104 [Nocardioidaceae bacterium]|nr:hypothetical protein [Nocardioidaceae bacterium]
MTLRPLSDVSAADWFVDRDLPDLGPAGFEAYARVLHPWIEGANGERTERMDGYLPDDQLAALCRVLARHTSTPELCFFALWDGYGEIYGGESTAFLTAFAGPVPWPARPFRQPRPKDPPPAAFAAKVLDGPRLTVSTRDFFLFDGPISQAGAWGAVDYGHGIPRRLNSPNLIWPADHAWFVSTDIEGSWSGIGGSAALVDELLRDPQLEVVRTRYDDPAARR